MVRRWLPFLRSRPRVAAFRGPATVPRASRAIPARAFRRPAGATIRALAAQLERSQPQDPAPAVVYGGAPAFSIKAAPNARGGRAYGAVRAHGQWGPCRARRDHADRASRGCER